MEAIQSINLISIDPNVRGGRPCIAGTTIEVSAIAIAKVIHMQTADEIASGYRLTLAQVYAALAYYYDHKAEIDAQIQSQDSIADAMKEKRIGSRHSPLFG
ncbi:MAG: DUF433 domain-containing protein [Anaerolineae bacterium]|nr:DUF433 domain-containing protein [Anaerolineae bacterium]